MKEIIILARAGQGAITSAILLASAAFEEGKHTCAFPHFGSERMGAPLNAYVRFDDKPIGNRCQVIKSPDYILVQDSTLLQGYNLDILKPGGTVIVNSPRSPGELGVNSHHRVITVPASRIAQEVLGRADRANAPLLGAFAAATGEVGLEALKVAARQRFPGPPGEKNAQAIQQGYDYIKQGKG